MANDYCYSRSPRRRSLQPQPQQGRDVDYTSHYYRKKDVDDGQDEYSYFDRSRSRSRSRPRPQPPPRNSSSSMTYVTTVVGGSSPSVNSINSSSSNHPRRQYSGDSTTTLLSVSPGAIVTTTGGRTIEIVRSRDRDGDRTRSRSRSADVRGGFIVDLDETNRERDRDRDRNRNRRDSDLYAARKRNDGGRCESKSKSDRSDRSQSRAASRRPTEILSERPSYRSERYLSVQGPMMLPLERTRSTGSVSLPSRRERDRELRVRDDGHDRRERQDRQDRQERLARYDGGGDDDDDDDDDSGSSPEDRTLSRRQSKPTVPSRPSRPSDTRPKARKSRSSSMPLSLPDEFRYKPLDPDVKQAIRILRVRPDLVQVDGHEGGLIACDLEHTSISESRYSTVSYAWGDPDDPIKPILVDGCLFTVRKNLHHVLRHLRKFHAGRAMWIDAIVINQADLDEKSQQVQMMSKIYAGTAEVFVWLGPHLDHVRHAIRCMLEYEDHMSDYSIAMRISQDREFWRGFRAINSAAYWNRVWVIQEFITPHTGRIIQGDEWVDFDRFQKAIRVFDAKFWRWGLKHAVFWGKDADDFAAYISNIHPLWKRRTKRAQQLADSSPGSRKREVDAEWALLSGRRYCQDIRDRVYGIMPLATNGSTLRVDYRLNPFEVLLESIWLEHNSNMDRTDVLMNLANILMLTPASICIYAQKRTSQADLHLRRANLPSSRRRTEQMHLRAAASPEFQDKWIRAAAATAAASRSRSTDRDRDRDTKRDNSDNSGPDQEDRSRYRPDHDITWHNFAVDQVLKIPKNLFRFPKCPWNMLVYTSAGLNNHVGLKLAVIDSTDTTDMGGSRGSRGSRSATRSATRSHSLSRLRWDRDRDRDDRDREGIATMTDEEFIRLNKKKSLALGVYRTKCSPCPLTIYYALTDRLEDTRRAGHNVGLFGALQGLDDLDLDL